MPPKFSYKQITIFCAVLQATNAFAITPAQQVQSIFSTVDPGRVSKETQQSLPTQPKFAPRPTLTQPKEQVAAPSDKIKFKISKVTILGNTVYSDRTLEAIFKPYYKKMISLTKLQSLVHDVTVKYREAGYILTHAILPPQVIKDGRVKVQVIEGFVGGIVIKGDPGKARDLLSAYGHHVMASKPLNINVLERYALLANDLPGYSIQFVLTPSKTIPAAADLTFVTSRKKFGAFIAEDNYGTRYIGPNEVSVGANLYSLITGGDNNAIRFTETTRPHELQYVELNHTQPIGTKGWRWMMNVNYAQTHPGFILTPAYIIGRNAAAVMDFSYPIIRDRTENFMFHGGTNYQNVTATILEQPFYQDRIRSLVAGVSYENMDKYRGMNAMGINWIKGFDILGAHDHFYQSRPNGTSIYSRFTGNLSRTQVLNSRFSFLAAMQGQYTPTTLLATEQFGFGGPDFGRGYDPSEIVGDMGVAGKAELRYDTFPDWTLLKAVQYYIFYDIGDIWNRDKVNLPPQQSAASAGFGARFTLIPQITGNFFMAKPLTKPVATMVILGRNGNAFRMFFQVMGAI